MKRLDKYILKSYLGPMVLTFSIAVFVLLLQFLWKKIEQIVGKGLEFSVIFEMIAYACATLVPMALPLSILLAAIMTMGNLGEKYELVAMKSSGLSLWRILRPLIVLSLVFCLIAFIFSNNVIPSATNKLRLVSYEIKTKKPALNIKPGQFYSEIENYTIKIGAKDETGRYLNDIIIYDHSKDLGNNCINIADSGQMYTSQDGNTLIFELFDGNTFEEDLSEGLNPGREVRRMSYKQQTIRFDISDFAYKKTDEDRYEGHYKTLDVVELKAALDTLKASNELYVTAMQNSLFARINDEPELRNHNIKIECDKSGKLNPQVAKQLSVFGEAKKQYYSQELSLYESKLNADEEMIRRHEIEFHRKFTLSAACLILFFIGAPLGAIIRKGGLGMPVVISTLAFIIYHIVGQIGENAAVGGSIPVWVGMWLSSIVFLPLGIVLTMKATSDSSLFNSESWMRAIEKLFHIFKTKKSKQDNENTANLL
jgi:lipopolysaccharide export system permease protein